MRKILLAFVFLGALHVQAQTVQSPDDFLGYKVGTKFTRHFKIVDYFKSVAQARPDMVKLEKYGETYEGRDLMLAFIALPENLQRLDAIRANNLRLAGIAKDKMAPQTEGMPAIVWLSYNVHGNEPSSSEAAMRVLYALADPANKETKEWLKNLVIIIDPCINPDGRDRYVNWYNNAAGKNFNAYPFAREHQEPWPQGRTNHYNFDLNRDWAWQTQIESQQRIKVYNQWLPQVHVDYHEQGYNAPYYFAPAAEPYHEVITGWQREFQVQIGKNNAKYFDANGWLYFTKEIFDLLYPSYGDTYPSYNGSIGMTYEQGGIGAGLGVRTKDGDTLTLVDRSTHHYTTSLATIETSAKNAARLVTEFKKYFDDNRKASGSDYKTYILTAKDANQLNAVATLLDNNGIEYGSVNATNVKGYNYVSGKDEAFSDEGYQLAVSAFQPKSRMVKVLFEPRSFISDSATYDITAWSVPFVYGVKAYALREKVGITPYKKAETTKNITANYGLLVPYTSMSSVKVLAQLLSQGVKVRYSEKAFIYHGKNYAQGTLIILKGNNVNNWQQLANAACKQFNVQPDDVESGFVDKGADFGSSYIHFIKAPRVALLTGKEVYSDAAGEVWSFFDNTINYPVTQINADNIGNTLKDFDVLIMPNGNYGSLGNNEAQEKIKAFIRSGGKVIALENGAAKIAGMDMGLKEKQNGDTAKNKDDYADLKKYGDRERDFLPQSIPGAIYKVQLDNTHPLAFGYPDYYYTLKQDTRMFEFLKEDWNVGVIKRSGYISGFAGSKVKSQLQDGLLFGDVKYGNGNIVVLTDDVLFRLFWENGKMMFSNAVFLVGQ
ncbi:zinc carboxypeptidase [Panacibacter sp. DH6]|uniref:Zinc carboxypeptidase n=1 Tax=Panacibacter microcysteis TaxID=2793269 RepID=A0A931E593_9BACT|nr:M14 family metallopeptidase [Panacibacter microcysteis]MBG9375248.1 zinc carboxypeptidase [Panacibacter microcysteis]